MARSLKKMPFCPAKLRKKVIRLRKEAGPAGRVVVKTWARAATILPEFVGSTFMVHNGKTFVSVLIYDHLVGYKLGEFAPTRTFRGHSGDRKTK